MPHAADTQVQRPGAEVVDVALRDGSTVRVRPVRPGDAEALERFLAGLSPASVHRRFFSAGVNLHRAATQAAAVVAPAGHGIVVLNEAEVVAHAAWQRDTERRAEVAFEVAEAWQGRGIASVLLAHLAASAAAAGIETFEAFVLPENRRMLDVFRASGQAVAVGRDDDVLRVEMPAALGVTALRRFEDREAGAAAAAVARVMRPGSLVVVGSRRPGSVGAEVVANLQAHGYRGRLAAVNRSGGTVGGLAAQPSVREVPFPVELAVIAVPALSVADVARDCAAARVPALVVLSGGFAEAGEAGRARQQELVAICRESGMRLVGPNCLGVANPDPAVRLDATFGPATVRAGALAVASQSGAYGIAAIAEAGRRGLGLSGFVSTGDKADLSGNDLLCYWERDPATEAILLYLESFGNPRKFGRIARRVSASKPIVAVKAGRSAAGARAAASHTGALVSGSDRAVDALLAHAGVIRARTLGEAIDAAALVTKAPLPRGPRVAIVTNAGGPGIAAVDACEAHGLELATLSLVTRGALSLALPEPASPGNPLDLFPAAGPADYERAISVVGADPGVDAIVAISIPTRLADRAEIAGALVRGGRAAAHAGTPLLSVLMAQDAAAADDVPVYPTPEEAVRALAHAVAYASWRGADRAVGEPPRTDPDAAAALLTAAAAAGREWLEPADVATLLNAYGVPSAEAVTAADPAAAGQAAAALGGPVAVKGVATGLIHKSDVGGVRLDVRGAEAAEAAARDVARALAAAGTPVDRFLVQQMAPPGVEMLVGVVGDPDFGAVVACAAGGMAAELIGDVQVRLAPIGEAEAAAMVRALRTFPLLDGFRGAPRACVPALEDVVVRISALAAAHPQIAELDCNPVIVSPHGAVVVDARVRLTAPPAPRPWPALDR